MSTSTRMNHLVHIGPMGSSLFGISDPSPIIRLSLSIIVVGIAMVGGRWLAALASRVPAYRPHSIHLGKEAHNSLDHSTKKNSAGQVLGRITFACVGLVAVVAVLLIWFSDQKTLTTVIVTATFQQFLATLALRIVGSLLVFACMLGFGRLFQRSIEGHLIHAHVSRNLVLLAGRTVYIASLVVGVIIILALWGTGIVLPVALGGALTVALTLALQDMLRNLVSGVYLLLEHPFVIGDHIMLAPYSGRVEDIQIRYTALRTEDNQRVLIPNLMLFTGPVVNLSAYDASRGVLLMTVPDTGGAEIHTRASEQIRTALATIGEIRPEPAPQMIISGVSAGKLQLRVVFWLPTQDPEVMTAIYSRIIAQVRSSVEGAEVIQLDPAASSSM